MSIYSFDAADLVEVEKPKSSAGRKAAPNPLLDAVKSRNIGDKPVQFKVPYGSEEALDKRKRAIGRDLSNAARELDVAVRRQFREQPTKPGASEGTLYITFWHQAKPGNKADSK